MGGIVVLVSVLYSNPGKQNDADIAQHEQQAGDFPLSLSFCHIPRYFFRLNFNHDKSTRTRVKLQNDIHKSCWLFLFYRTYSNQEITNEWNCGDFLICKCHGYI